MIHKELFCDLYSAQVEFFSDCSAKEMNDMVAKKYPGVPDHDWGYMCGGVSVIESTEDRSIIYLVWLENYKDFFTLAHESFHLISRIFEDRGVLFSFDNQEPYAYYLDFWIRTLFNVIKDSKVAKRKVKAKSKTKKSKNKKGVKNETVHNDKVR